MDSHLMLKKMALYLDNGENYFFKRKEKKPAQQEYWVIFGEDGQSMNLSRNEQQWYKSGKLQYQQDDIFCELLSGMETEWMIYSSYDTLWLKNIPSVNANSHECRLYRTINLAEDTSTEENEKLIEIVTFKLENENLKRMIIIDKAPGMNRWTGHKLIAAFLSAHLFGMEKG